MLLTQALLAAPLSAGPPTAAPRARHAPWPHTRWRAASPRLLIDGLPRRQVVRHHAPWRARLRNPAQTTNDVAQRVVPLRSILGHEGQRGSDKGPCIVTDIPGVGFAFHTVSVSLTRSA
jgi:hypothetical protein